MKIIGGWHVSFIDKPRRVIVTKPGVKNTRKICYKYIGDYRVLKRVDCLTGTALTDIYNRLPDQALAELKDIVRARWAKPLRHP